MTQSYFIYACTRANHVRYSSVHVTFRGSRMQCIKVMLSKKQVESVDHNKQYHIKFVEKSQHLKRGGRKVFA